METKELLRELRKTTCECADCENIRLNLLARYGAEQRLEAYDKAARECDRVALMSMKEIEELSPGWLDSECGSEVLCEKAIRRLIAAELERKLQGS